MTGPIDRRRVLLGLAAVPALAAAARLVTACTDDGTPSPTADDVAFAAPWSDLVDDDVRDLGRAIRTVDPGALAHARARLLDLGLDAACRLDGDESAVSLVAGWLMPRTLAGLVAALSAL